MAIPKIHGVFPPTITPFRENGDVDEDAYLRNIERWNSTGLSGYLVLGSNSEAVFLSEKEKLRLIELTAKNAAPEKLVLAGTGLESARETIRLTNAAARAGAQAALVLTPFYYIDQMGDQALIRYFTEVADYADIPILIYNVPKFTHLNIALNVAQALCGHPNIAGMKDSSGNVEQLAAFRRELPSDFTILVGTASGWFRALGLGISGGILALANCAPNECVEVQRLFSAGKTDKAEKLSNRLLPVNVAVTATYGVAGLKYACEVLGYESGRVRIPLLPLGETDRSSIRRILQEAGLLEPDDS